MLFSLARVCMMVLTVVSLIILGVGQSWGDSRLSHLENVMDTTEVQAEVSRRRGKCS